MSSHVIDYEGCDWSVLPFRHGVGSTVVHSDITLEDCLDICRNTEDCLGLDWLNATVTCWLHLSQENIDKAEYFLDSTLYVIQDRAACGTHMGNSHAYVN